MLVGAGGLAVETSFDYFQKTHLQAAADAAAFAGALENRAASSNAVMTAAATSAATQNGWSSTGGTLTMNSPPTSGAYQNNTADEVILTQSVPRFFSAYFSSTPQIARVRAVAIYQTAANACILALDKTASGAVNVQGSASVTLTGCDVMSNSVSSSAVNIAGAGAISTDCVVSAGGISNSGGLTLTGCPSAITGAPRAHDPFSGLAVPPKGSNQNAPSGKGNYTLSPGYYPGGMDVKGNVTLQPGTYYISGSFSANAGASISGTGVTLFFESGTQISINGGAHLDMSAPTSGTYSGMLFYGDPNDSGGSVKINGDATSSLTGDLYFPNELVQFQGNFSGQNGCMHIVADEVNWTGNATVGVNCSAYGMAGIPARQFVKVVE